MRFFLILIISCFIIPLSFSQSQGSLATLYSHYVKGLVSVERGDFLQGLAELEKAKNKDPKSAHIRLKIASVLIRLNRFEEAEVVLKEAKAIDPDNLDIPLALILVYSYREKNEELEEEYEGFLNKAHEKKPEDIGIFEYLAQFHFYKNRPQEAIKAYEKILEIKPDYVEAFFWLGLLYDEDGQNKKAIEIWEKGRRVDPSFAPILNCLGYAYAQSETNLDEALRMVKRALQKEPKNGAYLDSLGWIYYKKGELDKAKMYIIEALGLVEDPDIYEHLGDIYMELGDKLTGFEYYKKGFLQFPDSKSLKMKVERYEKEDKFFRE